eukprot:CAMPEP_0197434948 /NCGR_PEP_ID=MMETSP1175-20131217/2597_1 /TAXON_ID=1003142 /ORGANISM="Triceratium dubium, Strain CCMP147" /LENGTH=273 /DNA_ID=CAMNT_0042963833 /DNA_START=242 /DNA_END=1063 /DNA_ORIENTATION=+
MFLAIAAPCVALPQAAFVPSPRPHPASEKSVRIIPGMDDLGAASGEFPQEVMEHAVEKLKEAITDTINAEKITKMSIADVAESTVRMVENAVDFVAEKEFAAEKALAAAHAATLDALEERNEYVFMKYNAKADAKAAEDRALASESYDTYADDLERRRDMAVSHAAHRLQDDATHLLYQNKGVLRNDVKKEKEILEELNQLRKNHVELDIVLKELRSMVNAKSLDGGHYEYAALDEFGDKPLEGRATKIEHYEYAMLDEFGLKPLETKTVKMH